VPLDVIVVKEPGTAAPCERLDVWECLPEEQVPDNMTCEPVECGDEAVFVCTDGDWRLSPDMVVCTWYSLRTDDTSREITGDEVEALCG